LHPAGVKDTMRVFSSASVLSFHMNMKSSARKWLILTAAGLAVAVAAIWCVRHAGRWLYTEDSLEKAHAIVILSGRMPLRAQEAAELYREGWAPEIWVTRPSEPARELEAMKIPYVGEEFYSERILLHYGVPADAMHILDPPITNTASEVDVVAKELELTGGSSVILVTTKAHTRRVRTLWHKRIGSTPRAMVRAARADTFDPARWWRSTGDALDVVREVLGLANAWAGLPLKPGQ
jgi:uncharacterized SAM-binding protein YcdF (DUF218 family)